MLNETPANRGRVFAYCHDSVGIGHLSRTLAICERIGETCPFTTFLLATGTPYIALFDHLPRLDYIKLPSLAKEDERSYCSKYLSVPTEQMIQWRKTLLRHTVEQFDPDVVLVDKAPVGVCGELVPTLEWLRRNRPDTRVVFGMRDIEDAPETTIEQWAEAGVFNTLERCYDEIWVYGMRGVFDVVAEYRLPKSIQAKLRYMGYVARDPCRHAPPKAPAKKNIVVTVGGGTDGEFLLSTYLEQAAERASAAGMRSTLIGGPDLPPEIAGVLRDRASKIDGVDWVDFKQCLNCLIRDAAMVVSMGGYNTLCQIASYNKPALIVPRTQPRLEQAIRARLWSARGIVEVLEPAQVTPKKLADRVAEMIVSKCGSTTPDVQRDGLDLDGLDRISDRLGAFWKQENLCATAVRL